MEDCKGNEVPTEASMEKILSIPLIANVILKYLPTQDLLNCSLVNRHWRSVSRHFLRENRKCLVQIVVISPRGSLEDLLKLVENSSDLPFNGFSISLLTDRSCLKGGESDESDIMKNLLSEIPVQNLKISWNCCSNHHENGLSVDLILKILKEYSLLRHNVTL